MQQGLAIGAVFGRAGNRIGNTAISLVTAARGSFAGAAYAAVAG